MAEQEPVTVERCDTEIAAEAYEDLGDYVADAHAKSVRDHDPLAHQFARHRLAATKAADERVRVLLTLIERYASHDHMCLTNDRDDLPCTCGLAIARAALAEAGGRGG